MNMVTVPIGRIKNKCLLPSPFLEISNLYCMSLVRELGSLSQQFLYISCSNEFISFLFNLSPVPISFPLLEKNQAIRSKSMLFTDN